MNLLNANQARIADVFAGRVRQFRHDRFACATWRTGTTGAPELEGALIALNCKLVSENMFASHYVLIGEIVNIELDYNAPLLYLDRAYHCVGAAIAVEEVVQT